MNKAHADELFQCCLGKPLHIQGIPADEQRKRLDFLGGAFRIGTIQGLRIIHILDFGLSAAYRAGCRNGQIAALCQVFRNLWNDHICLINRNPISDAELQLLHNTHIVYGSTAYRSALQFYRHKNGYRVNEPRPAGAPLHLRKSGFPDFIRPLKSNGIPREFCRPPQGFSVGNVFIGKHQSVGRHIIGRNFIFKFGNSGKYGIGCYHFPFHDFKSLFFQKTELLLPGIVKIHVLCADQCKCVKAHVSLRRYFIVKLSDTAAAQISGIFIFGFRFGNFFVYFFKIRIGDNRLSS